MLKSFAWLSASVALVATLAGCGTPVASMGSAYDTASVRAHSTGTKRALMVGINHYISPGHDLQGCVNDINDAKAVLLKSQGFSDANVTTLLDKQATRANMLSALEHLVDVSQPGDFVYFHYSGHGAQVRDTNGDEPDGQDEILCPADIVIGSTGFKNVIVDDEIQTILGKLKPGVGFLMVSDSCHSGTIDRMPLPFGYASRPRTIVIPKGLRNLTPMLYDKASQQTFKARAASGQYEILSGCQDDQTSADAYINGRYNGAMTYYLLDAYKKGGANMTYGDWLKGTKAGLAQNNYDQVPNLTGNAGARIFSLPSSN